MANIKNISILDFVEWCKTQVDLSKLSKLMTSFGYTDDSIESVADALQNKAFRAEFKALLKSALNKPKTLAEQQRANGELTANDWLEMANSNGFSKATGNTWWDVVSDLIKGVGDVLNPDKEATLTAAQIAEQKRLADIEAAKQKASNTFMYIILAVVVLAVIVILFLSTRKK